MYSTIRYEIADGIGIATINRPEVLNALNSTVIAELGGWYLKWRTILPCVR